MYIYTPHIMWTTKMLHSHTIRVEWQCIRFFLIYQICVSLITKEKKFKHGTTDNDKSVAVYVQLLFGLLFPKPCQLLLFILMDMFFCFFFFPVYLFGRYILGKNLLLSFFFSQDQFFSKWRMKNIRPNYIIFYLVQINVILN